MEEFFNKCRVEYGCKDVHEITHKVTDASGFIIDYEVLQRELSIMEKYYSQLRTELTSNKEELEQKLNSVKGEVLRLREMIQEHQKYPRERKSPSQI